MFQFCALNYVVRVHNSNLIKYIHFIQRKGLRLDVSQGNSLKTHYLIQDWFHLDV